MDSSQFPKIVASDSERYYQPMSLRERSRPGLVTSPRLPVLLRNGA
jgi:hypothetical protein